MNIYFYIFISTLIVSALSFVGVLTLSLKKKILKKFLILLVALSAGTLLGGAFIHMLPESLEKGRPDIIFIYVLAGILIYYLTEKILHWQHCHEGECNVHTFAYMNIIGDAVHNFMDGLIIASAFLINVNIGIITSIALAAHEIPSEIGDFGVLLYAGFKVKKAIIMNFISALFAVLGGFVGFSIARFGDISMTFILPIAAGGFIYIAVSDLIPEIRKHQKPEISLLNFLMLLFGIGLMYLLKIFFYWI